MFQSLFNPQNTFFRFTGRVLDVIVLSLLWLVCSLPIVTIGPASAALYYSCVKCLRRGENGPYRSFLDSFKENLKVGTGATVLFLLLGEALLGGYFLLLMFLPDPNGTVGMAVRVAYLLLSLLPAAMAACAFPLLSRFTCGIRELMANSLRMTFRHLLFLVPVAVLNAVLVVVTWMGWYLGLMLLTPALGALLSSFLLEPVFRKYTPAGAEPADGAEDGKPWYLR